MNATEDGQPVGEAPEFPHLSLAELASADVVTRARYAHAWGSGDRLHMELADEVNKLRDAINAIRVIAESCDYRAVIDLLAIIEGDEKP